MSSGDLKARRKNWTGGHMDAKAVDEEFRSIRRGLGAQGDILSSASLITSVSESGIGGDRVLTGTSNQIKVTDNGAGSTIVLSIPDPFNPPGVVNAPNTKLQVGGFQVLPIIQIQTYSTNTLSSTTSSTFTSTNLSGSFTPKLNTSKLLIFAAGNFSVGTGDFGYITISRGSTNLAPTSRGFFVGIQQNNYSTTMIAYDSPATTSATTYSVQMRTSSGGATLTFPVSDGTGTAAATMIIAEIAQ